MKIVHPTKGFSGYARCGDYGAHFLAGAAFDKAENIPRRSRQQMEAEGFQFIDERRQAAQDDAGGASEGDQPSE